MFPAHAGISRKTRSGRLRSARVPRPRGDLPSAPMNQLAAILCSPPTRGSPDIEGDHDDRRLVFPAHAGISRRELMGLLKANSVPRPRGDLPSHRLEMLEAAQCSPPTRGSPAEKHDIHAGHIVFPAHAGISRRRFRSSYVSPRVPRPRGDLPQATSYSLTVPPCSPPTRGSPVDAALIAKITQVFPAHAGISRGCREASQGGFGVPRPRGDLPSPGRPGMLRAMCSPPTRGSPAA